MRLLLAVSILALLPATALCQSMVESAILSGAVAGSASGAAASTGSALSKSLGNIDTVLGRAAAGTTATRTTRASQTRATPALPKPPQAAFEGVEPGTPRTDLIAKAGKPQFAIASSDDEMLRYTTKEGGAIRIRIVDGKVSTIEQTPPSPTPTPSKDPAK